MKIKEITAAILSTALLLPSACFNIARAADINGWSFENVGGVSADVNIDKNIYHSGDGSLKIDVKTPAIGNVYLNMTQNVSVEEGKKYYVGAKVRLKNATTADFMVDWGTRYSATRYGGTCDWTNFEFLYEAEQTGSVVWRFIAEGYGEIWLDDCIFIDIETGKNLLVNPNFDTVSSSSANSEMISKENLSNDELYKAITKSESFAETDINKVLGGFKYIPVYQADGIKIDGNVEDWAGYDPISMSTLSNQYQIYMNDSRLLDVEATCRFAYDDKYLYMLVEVEDDIYYYLYGMGQYWQGDSLQLAISSLNEGYGTEIGLAVDPESGDLDIWGVSAGMTPMLSKGSHLGTKTIYEVGLPWDTKFTSRPDKIKFDILVNDNDGDGRRYCAELAPGISEGKVNSRFPVLEFLSGKKEWYGWIESSAGTNISTDTPCLFNYYVVNRSGEAQTINITGEEIGEKTIELAPHSGVRGEFTKTFTEENDYTLKASFESGGEVSEASIDVKVQKPKATVSETEQAIETLSSQVKELRKLIKQCSDKGIKTKYEDTHCDILEKFITFLRDDINDGDLDRVNYTARVTTRIYNEDKEALKEYLAGTKTPLDSPDFITGEVTNDEISYYADMLMPDGSVEKRPVFFNGYGHNLSVETISDLESYGANATQFETGPSRSMSSYPGWNISTSDGPDCNYMIENNVVKDGKNSFKVIYNSALKANQYCTMTQVVPTVPGHSYTLKGYMKADNLTDELTVFPNDWLDGMGYQGTFDWMEITRSTVATSKNTIVRFVFQAKCDAVYLDSFEFYDNENPDVNLLRNGSFEDSDGKMPIFDMNAEDLVSALEKLEAAEKANVYVDFGIAPHYFFEDIIQNYNIGHPNNMFIKYNINAPIARELVEDFLRNLLPLIKDYKSLHSICISNEPAFNTRDCGTFYNEQWWEFLRKRYNNNIAELNKSYGTDYTDFSQIDQQSTQKQPAKNYDYYLFNTGVFADWHRWLADIVHELAPGIKVQSKLFQYIREQPTNMLLFGINAELFADFIDLNGCDAYNYINEEQGVLTKEMWYDYLQSIKQVPVLDGENHFVGDRDESNYYEEVATHIGQDIYNGAVHGRSNAISWILARSADKNNQVRASILYRPDALVASANATYDLNRLANEITAIQREPHEIGILYTNSSAINNNSTLQSVYQAYKAVAFNGKIARFVLETQLEKMDNYKVLIIPQITFAAEETYEKIADYIRKGGRVIILNENSLSKTDKNLDVDPELRSFIFNNADLVSFSSFSNNTPESSVAALNETYRRVLKEEGLSYVELIDTETGKPCENVEYVLGVYDGKLIVNIANFRDRKGAHAKVKLIVNGEEVTKMTNLRTMEETGGEVQINAYDVSTFAIDIDNPFLDTYNKWCASEVSEAYGKQLIEGISDTRFEPDADITRAQFLTLIVRAAGVKEYTYKNEIKDVAEDAWYANAIASALKAGIITKDNFRPDDKITREEMCELLINAYESANGAVKDYKTANFTDAAEINNIEAVSKTASLGIILGDEDGSFRPNGTATRAEAAAVINRFDNLK